VGQPVTCARRRRAIVDPGCSFRVENVCAYNRIPRGSRVRHRAHAIDAVLDGRKGTVWGYPCEAGQFPWWGPQDTIRRGRTKDKAGGKGQDDVARRVVCLVECYLVRGVFVASPRVPLLNQPEAKVLLPLCTVHTLFHLLSLIQTGVHGTS
jgi:hypothetical protein